MKKTSSFHLEEDIYIEIIKYQHENNLSSRNTALERMILEFKSLRKELEDKEEMLDLFKSILENKTVVEKNTDNNPSKEMLKNEESKNVKLRGSILNAFDNMPDGE